MRLKRIEETSAGHVPEIRYHLGGVSISPKLDCGNSSRAQTTEWFPHDITWRCTCRDDAAHELKRFLIQMQSGVFAWVVNPGCRASTIGSVPFDPIERRVSPHVR